MKCQEAKELLTPYLNNEVTRSERELLQAHLSQCEHCWQELSALSAVQQRLRTALAETAHQAQVPPQAWPRLRVAIKTHPQPRLALRLPLLSSFGALVVAGLSVLMVTSPLSAPVRLAPTVSEVPLIATQMQTVAVVPQPTLTQAATLPDSSQKSSTVHDSAEPTSEEAKLDWFTESALAADDSLERISNAERELHKMPTRRAEAKICRCVRAV